MSMILLWVPSVITPSGRQSISNATVYVSLSSLFRSTIFIHCEGFLNSETLFIIIIIIIIKIGD
jgi:hypothetical protein